MLVKGTAAFLACGLLFAPRANAVWLPPTAESKNVEKEEVSLCTLCKLIVENVDNVMASDEDDTLCESLDKKLKKKCKKLLKKIVFESDGKVNANDICKEVDACPDEDDHGDDDDDDHKSDDATAVTVRGGHAISNGDRTVLDLYTLHENIVEDANHHVKGVRMDVEEKLYKVRADGLAVPFAERRIVGASVPRGDVSAEEFIPHAQATAASKENLGDAIKHQVEAMTTHSPAEIMAQARASDAHHARFAGHAQGSMPCGSGSAASAMAARREAVIQRIRQMHERAHNWFVHQHVAARTTVSFIVAASLLFGLFTLGRLASFIFSGCRDSDDDDEEEATPATVLIIQAGNGKDAGVGHAMGTPPAYAGSYAAVKSSETKI